MHDLIPAESMLRSAPNCTTLPRLRASALPVVLGLNPNRSLQAIAAAVRSYLAKGQQHVLLGEEVAKAEAGADAAERELRPASAPMAMPDAAAPVDDKGWIVQPDPKPRRGVPESKR